MFSIQLKTLIFILIFHISTVVIIGTKIDPGSGNCWMVVFFIDQRNCNSQVTCQHFEHIFVIIADEMKNKNDHIEEGK